MAIQWDNRTELSIIDYRNGGPGNSWAILDTQSEMTAPSGGGVSVDSKWGRAGDGRREYIGSNITSLPERFTFDIMYRMTIEDLLKALSLAACPFDLRARSKCGDIREINNFQGTLEYFDALVTSLATNEPPVTNSEQAGSDVMDTLSMSAGLHGRKIKLQHTDISRTTTDVAINVVLYIGPVQCTGDCGDLLTGIEEIVFCTDLDAAPGYAGTSAPYVGISVDSGATWTLTSIDDFLTADATGMVKVGSNLVLFSPNHAPTKVSIQDLKDDLGPTSFVTTSGISANFPRNGVVTPNGDIFAFGDGGYIYVSTDGGGSWTSFDAAVITTQNLTQGAVASDNLIWIGGAAGALVKIKGAITNRVGSLATVEQSDNTALSDAITSLAVAPGRTGELHIGTDAGTIWRSKTADTHVPVYTLPTFPSSGAGSVDDLKFAGYRGDVLFIIQTNAAGRSRVLLDYSGGALGLDTEPIGTFVLPSTQGINSIAVFDANNFVTVGEVDGSNGFIGLGAQ